MEHPSEITAEAVHTWSRPAVMVPVFVLMSLVGGFFPSFSVEATLYVMAIGGTMTWLGLSGRVPKRVVPDRLGAAAAWWLLPALLLALIELTDFLLGSTSAHPTLSLLMDPLLAGYLVRSVAYLAWLAAFWALVRR